MLADPVFDADDERLHKEVRERLARERQAPAPAKEKPAVPTLTTDELTRTVRSTGLEGERGSLARLPYTRAEAQALLALAPKTQSFGAFDFAANQNAAIDPALGQYRYVHFAMHGLLNDTHLVGRERQATAVLMTQVYRGMLGKGLRPAAALRAAQLELSKQPQWRAPYYWASFVLMGEPQ